MEALDSVPYDNEEPAPEISLEDEQLEPVEQPIEQAEKVGLASKQRKRLPSLCNDEDKLPLPPFARVEHRKVHCRSARLFMRRQPRLPKWDTLGYSFLRGGWS